MFRSNGIAQIALLFVGGGLPLTSASAQSVYEVQLGMPSAVVESLIGEQVENRTQESTLKNSEHWSGKSFDIFFCRKYVTAIRIKLDGSVKSFSRTVEAEKIVRGAPEMKFESHTWGEVTAEWHKLGQGFFSISLSQHRDAPLEADRWSRVLQICS